MHEPCSLSVSSAGDRKVKPYHPTLVRGLAVVAKHVLDIETLRRLVDRAGESGFISDVKLKKLIDEAGERFTPKVAKTPEARFGEVTVRYSQLVVTTMMAMFVADARRGGTGRGVARKVEGIRRRCMQLGVLPFLGAGARGEVGKEIYTFDLEDVVVMCWSGTNQANVLALIGKGDNYLTALSEEDRRAVHTTLAWLRCLDTEW